MKKVLIALAAVLAAALAAVLIYDGTAGREAQQTFFAMDTVCSLTLTGRDAAQAAAAIPAQVTALETGVFSRQAADAAVARLNRNGGGALSDPLAQVLAQTWELSEKSGGALDCTLGAVSDLWDFGGDPHVPDAAQLRSALAHTGYQKLHFTSGGVSYDDPAAALDLGAVGKGAALDAVSKTLQGKRLRSGIVSLGGSILLLGGQAFTVGIKDPAGNAGECLATMRLSDCCISTSGSYERFFEENGERYHHILDPKTGLPVRNGLLSVTIVADSGLVSDALSTACFVLGAERGMVLAKDCGCEAVFVAENGDVTVSDGLRSLLTVSNTDYRIID
ncbi:MAG: FAD:protein FMN transferase [Clostridia bacterium]|nr:FAD:protein FMN transferase [Clostridia bacterium]